MAIIYKHFGYINHSLDYINKLIEINPSYVNAYLSKGINYLLLNQFSEGLKYYEYRFKAQSELFKPSTPMWNGEDIKGKKLVIWNEQGLGDYIQFIRYALLLKSSGIEVIILTFRDKSLTKLFQTCLTEKFTVISDNKVDEYDYHISVMSLPHIFQTTSETIPQPVPYIKLPEILDNDQVLTKFDNYKIGIVWASGKQNKKLYHKKSCNVKLFWDLLNIGNIELYSLQVGEDSFSQWKIDNGQLIMDRFHDLAPQINDFVDTANFIEQLDLIITVDTAVAHLAGAMGKPTWVLLPMMPDWRWLLEREDNPWYPQMRVFRQKTRDNWQEVFQEVKVQLTKVLQGKNPLFPIQQKTAAYYHNLACSYQQKDDFLQAIEYYKYALQINPHFAETYNNLGNTYQQQDNLEKALECYQKSIELKPSFPNSYDGIANIYRKQRQLSKAIEFYQKAIKIENNLPQTHYNLALTLLLSGNWQTGFIETVYKNREEAKQKGKLAAQFMEDWTWEKQIKRLCDVLVNNCYIK